MSISEPMGDGNIKAKTEISDDIKHLSHDLIKLLDYIENPEQFAYAVKKCKRQMDAIDKNKWSVKI